MIDWSQFKPTTEWAIKMLEAGGNGSDGTLYMETGVYKPWSIPVVHALKRRGYKVESLSLTTFLVHPLPERK
mgnify:FL=1